MGGDLELSQPHDRHEDAAEGALGLEVTARFNPAGDCPLPPPPF